MEDVCGCSLVKLDGPGHAATERFDHVQTINEESDSCRPWSGTLPPCWFQVPLLVPVVFFCDCLESTSLVHLCVIRLSPRLLACFLISSTLVFFGSSWLSSYVLSVVVLHSGLVLHVHPPLSEFCVVWLNTSLVDLIYCHCPGWIRKKWEVIVEPE